MLRVNGRFPQVSELRLQIEDEIKRIRKSEARLGALQEDVNKNVSMVEASEVQKRQAPHQSACKDCMHANNVALQGVSSVSSKCVHLVTLGILHRDSVWKQRFPPQKSSSNPSETYTSVCAETTASVCGRLRTAEEDSVKGTPQDGEWFPPRSARVSAHIPPLRCCFPFSENAVKQMQGEQRQMLQKITDNDEQGEKAKEEATRVLAQHGAIRAKLSERRHLASTEEEKARVRDHTPDAHSRVSFVLEKRQSFVSCCFSVPDRKRWTR